MIKSIDANTLVTKKYRRRGPIGEIFHRIKKNKGAMIGLIILALLFLIFFVSLFISFDSITATNVRSRFASPGLQYPFGADDLGRNLFLRVIYGTRYSIAIGFGVVAIGLVCGVILGSIAGYYGGNVENIIMRISDTMSSIPGMLSAMVIMTALGQSLPNLIIAMGVTSIPIYLRVSRASVLTVRDQEYIEAARAIGLSNFRIIFTQVLPNGMSPVIVVVTTSLGMTIIGAAGLSFIGFGVPAPAPEWGGLIATGRALLRTAPWVTTFPGLAIMFVVLAFNMLGDGLRDALDPKLKK
jgi:peptide/nickel transport system permease protein